MNSRLCPRVLYKPVGEARFFDFDFEDVLEEGETLSSPEIEISPEGPTSTPPEISGARVQTKISGGTAGTRHLVTCTVSSDVGETLEGSGYLIITEH